MKCAVLAENHADNAAFGCEHGLSLSLQSEGRHWIFDLGQGRLFLETAQQLGISLSTVDGVILSHGHYDHGGGLEALLQLGLHIPIYLSEHAFDDYYNSRGKRIGLDVDLKDATDLHFVSERYALSADACVCTFPKEKQCVPVDAGGLMRYEKGMFKADDFRHEMVLSFRDKGRHIVVSGCAHWGILNWVNALKPDVFIGGFHLSKWSLETQEDRQRLRTLAQQLKTSGTIYYTGHCTGDEQYAILKEILGEHLEPFATGRCFEI